MLDLCEFDVYRAQCGGHTSWHDERRRDQANHRAESRLDSLADHTGVVHIAVDERLAVRNGSRLDDTPLAPWGHLGHYLSTETFWTHECIEF